VKLTAVLDSETGPPGAGVADGVGLGEGAMNAADGEPPPPPPPHPHAIAHPANVRANEMKKRRARRADRCGIRVLPVWCTVAVHGGAPFRAPMMHEYANGRVSDS
jgi:hypothetical protein